MVVVRRGRTTAGRRETGRGEKMSTALRTPGLSVARQPGSPVILDRGEDILVVPDHDPVARGTAWALARDAGITVAEFNRIVRGR